MLALLTTAVPAQANAADTEEVDFCALASSLARTIIENRYKGVAMAQMMKVARSNPELEGLATALTVQAYNMPDYSTEKMQKKTITEFENATYMACYNSGIQ